MSSTWISTALATRIRTRALAKVVDSRPQADPTDRRAQRRSWAASVAVDAAARKEARCWIWFLPRFNGTPIRPPLFDSSMDGDIASDASDTGIGAFVRTRHGDPASSSLLRGLAVMAPTGVTMAALADYAQRGLEFVVSLPPELLSAISTLRELFGVACFILAAAHLLRGGRFRLFWDNLGCVYILGGVIQALPREAAPGASMSMAARRYLRSSGSRCRYSRLSWSTGSSLRPYGNRACSIYACPGHPSCPNGCCRLSSARSTSGGNSTLSTASHAPPLDSRWSPPLEGRFCL